jgi:GT2 family glycosyltransferase
MPPLVSVIVVTYNSADWIGLCLHALQQQVTQTTYEIVVVDNASQDATVALVQANYPDVQLLTEAENWGFAGGVNRGVAAARGDRLVLLNPDSVPHPEWLEQITAPLADETIGIVGSKVRGPDGRIQSVGTHLHTPVMLTDHRGAEEQDHGQYDALTDVQAVHGVAMAFPRHLWEEPGGLDEGYYPAYWEEVDFCERTRRAGYRVVVAPRSIVQHGEEASTTGKYSPAFYFYYHRNRLRYAAKWLDWPILWNDFRPAEQTRLAGAPLLDRRIARMVYAEGVPALSPPDAAQRAAVRAIGQQLRAGTLPADDCTPLLALLAEAEQNSVLEEVTFRSRVPLVARLRTAWNDVATRWYVRPGFDQQTRFNLALERTTRKLLEQQTARAAADALDTALLAWRLTTTSSASRLDE